MSRGQTSRDLSATNYGLTGGYSAHLERIARSPCKKNYFLLELPRELRDKIYRMSCGEMIRVCDTAPDKQYNHRSVKAIRERSQPTRSRETVFTTPLYRVPRERSYWNKPAGLFRSLSETCRCVRQEVFDTVLSERVLGFESVQAFRLFLSSEVFRKELAQHIGHIHIQIWGEGVQQWSLRRVYLEESPDHYQIVSRGIPSAHEIDQLREELQLLVQVKSLKLTITLSGLYDGDILRRVVSDLKEMTTKWFYTMGFKEGYQQILHVSFPDWPEWRLHSPSLDSQGRGTWLIRDVAGDGRESRFFEMLRDQTEPESRIIKEGGFLW